MTSKNGKTPSDKTAARPDLRRLAEHLGVSQTTVSRALNGSAKNYRISEETQQRVLAAAAKLNYKANALARSLRSKTVGVMVPEISEGYSTAVLGGIGDVLLLSGFFYFVVSHRHRAELLREYPSLPLARAVEGIIVVDSALEEDLPIPVVAVSDHHHRHSVVNIELDHLLAARYALEHLKRLHHREIAFIKGQTFSSDTLARWRAICKVAADLGIEINPRLVTQLEDHGLGTEPGRAATVRLLERGVPFTAIFAFNDVAAIGAITVLHEAGIQVPEQVSVVGFDDILSAATNNPPLTTVRQPLQEMGRAAASTLLQMINNERQAWPKHPIRVLPTFVERQSTATVRQDRKKRTQPGAERKRFHAKIISRRPTLSSAQFVSLTFSLRNKIKIAAVLGVCIASQAQQSGKIPPSSPQLATPAIERRVNDLLKQMTLDEKIGQLVQYNDSGYASATSAVQLAANPEAKNNVNSMELAATGRLGSMLNTVGAERTNAFQHAAVDKSRLHIPLLFGADIIHGYRTIYPQPLGLAATFDPELVQSLARMSAEESTTAGIRWFYSPMVDISRDARWGRTTEGAGEDPFLGAAMARAYVLGYQGSSLANPDSVAASVKHFAAYGAAEAGREYNTTDMSEIRLRQIYLPPYKAAVEAGAATIMSAFNALNGVPATANRFLMQNILRDEWGFNGFVVSDYTAVMELVNHGIALDATTATRKAFFAGVDVDMMSHFYDTQLPELVRTGQVPISAVDEAVRRVLRVKFALGLFEHPYARATEVSAAVPEHRPLVRKAAEESFVLLKNDSAGHPVLPLSSDAKKIALIGPLADNPGEMMGSWSGGPELADVVTIRAALEARAKQNGGSVIYAKGTEITGTSDEGFAEAVHAAGQSDVAVLALGESGAMSGEAGSRAHLDLPGNQEKLLEAVAATNKPFVLLVFSGRPLVLNWAAQHVAAIMEVWFPGTEAGSAIADLLYGDVAPSGKLPMSFPRAVGQEPLYYNQFPTGRPPFNADLTQPPGPNSRFISRYIDVPNDALFPFGYGLSYTQFSYGKVALSRPVLPLREANQAVAKKLITATTTVTNAGSRAATEIVQCYVRNLGASIEQPVRSLEGFSRVTLKPGESKQVSFDLGFPELSFYNVDSKPVIEPTHYTVWIGGSSLATEAADFKVIP